jgi:hypothetical protein
MKTMNLNHLSSLAIVMTFMTGCSTGIKFASVTPNLDLPSAYTSRSIYQSGVAAYEFQDLVGNILIIKKSSLDNPIRAGVITPTGFKDTVTLISSAASLNYYHSVITKGGALKGNYLAFSADFTDDEMADFTLVDVARASIEFNATTYTDVATQLKTWVQQHPKTDSTIKRIWIKDVVLSSSLYTAGTKISENASGVIGSTLGVNGSVYNTNNQTIKNTIICFEYFDVDDLVGTLSHIGADAITGDLNIPLAKVQSLKALPSIVISGRPKAVN